MRLLRENATSRSLTGAPVSRSSSSSPSSFRLVWTILVIGRFATPALRQMQMDAQRCLSPATLVARLKAIAQVDVTDQPRSVALPVLYMRATEDRLVPRSASECFLKFARRGRVALPLKGRTSCCRLSRAPLLLRCAGSLARLNDR